MDTQRQRKIDCEVLVDMNNKTALIDTLRNAMADTYKSFAENLGFYIWSLHGNRLTRRLRSWYHRKRGFVGADESDDRLPQFIHNIFMLDYYKWLGNKR